MARKFKKNMYKVLGLGLFFGGLLACEPEEPCVTLATNQYKTAFYQIGTDGTAVQATVSFDTIRALGTDSLFLSKKTNIKAVNLRLSASIDTTTFIFESGEEMDTLQLGYVRNFRVISPACGLEVRFTNPQVLQHTFDSVSVLTTELFKNSEGVDLEIYK